MNCGPVAVTPIAFGLRNFNLPTAQIERGKVRSHESSSARAIWLTLPDEFRGASFEPKLTSTKRLFDRAVVGEQLMWEFFRIRFLDVVDCFQLTD